MHMYMYIYWWYSAETSIRFPLLCSSVPQSKWELDRRSLDNCHHHHPKNHVHFRKSLSTHLRNFSFRTFGRWFHWPRRKKSDMFFPPLPKKKSSPPPQKKKKKTWFFGIQFSSGAFLTKKFWGQETGLRRDQILHSYLWYLLKWRPSTDSPRSMSQNPPGKCWSVTVDWLDLICCHI